MAREIASCRERYNPFKKSSVLKRAGTLMKN